MFISCLKQFCKTKRSEIKAYTQKVNNRSYSKTEPPSPYQPSYFHQIGGEPLLYRTLGQAVTIAAKQFGDRECLVSMHEKQRYTFQQIDEKTSQIAAGFISCGFNKGDRIGLWAPNNAYWYLTMLAAAKAGLILVAINPAYQTSEMEYCINKVGLKGIVAPHSYKKQNYYNILQGLAPDLPSSTPGQLKSSKIPSLTTVIIANENVFGGAYKFTEIPALATEESSRKVAALHNEIQPDDPCNIQFTSGTTGKSKAVVLSSFGLINNSYISGKRYNQYNEHHKLCMQLPLFHVFGTLSLVGSLQNGNTLILAGERFSSKNSLRTIAEEKCTTIFGAPTMYVDMVAKQKELNLCMDSLETVLAGGASCSPQLFKQIKDTFKVKTILSGYGLTETSSIVSSNSVGDKDENVLNTVGYVVDHAEVKVIDEDGKTVPMGTPGELCIRFFGNMLGYWDDAEKTAEVMGPDRWLKTGDKFVLRPDGYGSIVGRIKEMINRGGENIYPKEIEDFLNTHPDILETHVIGVPDERMGEEICAFVRLQKGAKFDHEILKAYCEGKISYFKVPAYLELIELFPKTVSGKVQKFKLKEIAEQRLANKFKK